MRTRHQRVILRLPVSFNLIHTSHARMEPMVFRVRQHHFIYIFAYGKKKTPIPFVIRQ